MSFLRRRFARTGFWLALVGIATLGPLAATVADALRGSTGLAASGSTWLAGGLVKLAPATVQPTLQTTKRASGPGRMPVESPSPLGPGSGLTPTFTTLPVHELHVDDGLPAVAPDDIAANAFSTGDGRVCVLELEEFRLRSLSSLDSGATFASEIDIAGGPGLSPVRSYAASLSSDGRLYVAFLAASPDGGMGLRFTRSDDMCLTWTPVLSLVQPGDPTYGVHDVTLATGSNGHASILYRGDRGWDAFVVSTSDFGVNWTIPVRVDAGAPPRSFRVTALDVAMDPSDRVYVAFTQDRFGNGASVWTATSFDGGQTFEPEQSADVVLLAHGRSERPDLRVASDGSLLLAFWDSGGPLTTGDKVYCLRSTNQGLSFALTLDAPVSPGTEASFPVVLATAPGTQTTFLFTADSSNRLSVYRSLTSGSSFQQPPTQLATSSSGSPDGSRPFTRVAFARSGTTWVVGWSDEAADSYARLRTDIYLRATTNEGTNWSPPRRVDTDLAGSSTSAMESVVATSNAAIFVLFRDGRPNEDRSSDVWATRASLPLLSPVPEYRIDHDVAPVSPRVVGGVAVASDGVSHTYTAFPVVDTGPFSSIRLMSACCGVSAVTVSADFGGDFRINTGPAVAATPDGFVYLAWTSHAPGGQAEVRFNRGLVLPGSPTFTALPSDLVLGAYQLPATYGYSPARVVRVQAVPGGEAYVLWSTDDHVFLSKWDEANQQATTQVINQSPDEGNNSARFCVGLDDGLGITQSAIIVGYLAPRPGGPGKTVWVTSSFDGGQSWEPRIPLTPETLPGGARQLEMACGAGPFSATATAAIAYWTDDLGGEDDHIFSSVRRGLDWGVLTTVTSTADDGFRLGLPSNVFRSVTISALLPYELATTGEVNVAASLDEGVSYTTLRVNETAPDPAARSHFSAAHIATRSASVFWLDESAGEDEVVVARIAGGPNSVTFTASPPLRVSTTEPQGTRLRAWDESHLRISGAGHATGTAGYPLAVAWRAQGESTMPDAVVNLVDLDDLDLDGAATGQDCNDNDPTVRFVGGVVRGVTVTVTGPLDFARIGWDSQSESAGSATTYDMVSGSLSALRLTRTFDGAACLAHGLAGPPYDDLRTGPALGDAFYYLIRAVNSCGFGSFGDSSLVPDPRDALDDPGTCP